MRLRVFVLWRFGGDRGAPSQPALFQRVRFLVSGFWRSEQGHGRGPLLPLSPGLKPQPRARAWVPVNSTWSLEFQKVLLFPVPGLPFSSLFLGLQKPMVSPSVCSRPVFGPSSSCKMETGSSPSPAEGQLLKRRLVR